MSLRSHQLDSVINTKIAEHKSNLYNELEALLVGQIQELTTSYENEIEKLTAEKDAQIAALRERIAMQEMKKAKNRYVEMFLLEKKAGIHQLHEVFDAWKWFTSASKRSNKIEKGIEYMRSGGIVGRVFQAWRSASHVLFRKRAVNRSKYEVNQSVADTKQEVAGDLEQLRRMVMDLTEDLRVETESKNSLKYQYEQALLRGMTALNHENLTLQSASFDVDRDMSQTGQQLMYTPGSPTKI